MWVQSTVQFYKLTKYKSSLSKDNEHDLMLKAKFLNLLIKQRSYQKMLSFID